MRRYRHAFPILPRRDRGANETVIIGLSDRRSSFKGINAPRVEPVEHERKNEDDEPQVGEASLLLSDKPD